MERTAYKKLLKWKSIPSGERKPLLLEGARQTGKTWLARNFGKNEFEEIVEINFEDNLQIRTLFESDFNVERIMTAISIIAGKPVVPEKTLLFFDEIQYANRGLLSLKYFFDKAPQYYIIAAGSLLGIIDHEGDSFPVGKVQFLKINPLDFTEFLLAVGQNGLVDILKSHDTTLIASFATSFEEYLRRYYYVGGMPEVVKNYIDSTDFNSARNTQKQILNSYQFDFSKHPPKEIVQRMLLVWNSVPFQLARENKKFLYSAVKQSARGRDYETSIQWLCNAGVLHKVTRVNAGELPIKGFEDPDSFKLYLLDIGLLGAMADLDVSTLLSGNSFFSQYKGALTEQFVLQELKNIDDMDIHYWTPNVGIAEVDFVIQSGAKVIPLEVKAERNLKSKSLSTFIERYKTTLNIRSSMLSIIGGNHIIDIPLYYLQHYIYKCR